MGSTFRRKSISHVQNAPDPKNEYYVIVTQGYPKFTGSMAENEFHEYDPSLAPSYDLMEEYDENCDWDEWAAKYINEVGRDYIHRRASEHAETAGKRDVVFCCYEPDSDFPRCHTFTILEILGGERPTTLSDFAAHSTTEVEETDSSTSTVSPWRCVEENDWCPGPGAVATGEELPCFPCYMVACDMGY